MPAITDYLKKNKPTLLISLHFFKFNKLKIHIERMIKVLRIYKNIYDTKGNKLSLIDLSNLAKSRKILDIVATDANW